jgi:NAD(P)-dependent dehydrogenase (short-subunit alcohol dehydrogenase family)
MEKGTALVFGASGGIGAALVTQLQARGQYDRVIALSRQAGDFDLEDDASLAAVVSRLAGEPPVRMVIVATGLLSDTTRGPDKSLRALDADWMMQNFRINSIGPALIARHIVPLMPRTGRSVFAALSARVGSISDNRLGGWHSYRASKAALNMLIRTIAIDLARTHPDALCVTLHPGTVDTELSRPFQRGIADGQIKHPDDSARALLDIIDSLSPAQSGRCFAWDGLEIAP